uniref:Protein disulfide isomerase n=1 Tax=Trypanosoma vivax (strain Y486) TaxID=1055687 RepID=G0U7A7_TRYVY|nr:protein disulfide isomerase [Trypanosoma vivax Y486]
MYFLLLLALGLALPCVESVEIINGTDQNFVDIVNKSAVALVKFYSPSCIFCQKLEPEWVEAAKNISFDIAMVDVNCVKETGVAANFSIKAYPTILLLRYGEVADTYVGARNSKSIVTYARSQIGPAVENVTDGERVTEVRGEFETVCVGLTSDVNSTLANSLAKVAPTLRTKIKFLLATDTKVLPNYKPESIVVFRSDGEEEVYDGPMEEANVTTFLSAAGVPFAGEINGSTYMIYSDIKKPMGWVFMRPKENQSSELKEKLTAIAKKVRSDVIILWTNVEEVPVHKNFGMEDDTKFPAFLIMRGGKRYVFPTNETLTADSLEKFAFDFIAGKINATIKSLPVPENETVDGLTTIVGSTFDHHVRSGKDLLIEFFAPWCGHCQRLAPTYAKLAKEVEAANVIIGALDATANDWDTTMFKVTGLPTIYFLPQGKEPILYDGDRSFLDLYKFIRNHSTTFSISETPTLSNESSAKNETAGKEKPDASETEKKKEEPDKSEGEKGDL